MPSKTKLAYCTTNGATYIGDSRELLAELKDDSVNLVITSTPFALQRQKEYGNLDQHEYINWLLDFARLVHRKLTSDGSFEVDLAAPT